MPHLSRNLSRKLQAAMVFSPPDKEHHSRAEILFVRDEMFYFDDGNTVLVAENVAFRVHKSVLTRHSNYFRELLVRQPGPDSLGTTAIFDGCPVVLLPNWSYEVSEVLRVLYDHIKIFSEDPWQLIGLLRLSVKFQIKYVTEFALEVLQEAYPTTLSTYDAYRGSRPKCEDVIGLAHEIRVPNVLPCAYYELCQYPMKIIATLNLSDRVLENYPGGRERLAARLFRFMDLQIPDGSVVAQCKLPSICPNEWRHLKVDAQRIISNSGYMTGVLPLSIIGSLVDLPCVDAMCSTCRGEFNETVRAERIAIWSSLPKIFNMGSWGSVMARNG